MGRIPWDGAFGGIGLGERNLQNATLWISFLTPLVFPRTRFLASHKCLRWSSQELFKYVEFMDLTTILVDLRDLLLPLVNLSL